jgi:spoIIIJ-associated protein
VADERVEIRVTLDGEPVADHEAVRVDLRRVEVPEADEDADADAEVSRSGEAQARVETRREVDDAGDRDDRGRGDRRASDSDESDTEPRLVTPEELDEEAEAAADLLEGLLDAMDLPGDLRIQVHEAHAEVEIVGLSEGVLIGRRGQTLEAVQDLVRTAMQRRFERRSRVLVDVDGYRARRLEKLIERAEEAVQQVLETGEPQRLEPMDSIERRLIHQRVAAHEGVVSRSHGREPARRIEIELSDDED